MSELQPLATDPSTSNKYLAFSLNGETYAMAIEPVREIIEYRRLTQIPMTPEHLSGVINLRGAVVPVVDLALRLGAAERNGVSRRTCIVILELPGASASERLTLGVVVDAVTAVRDIASTAIEPPPSFGSRVRSEFLQGMAKLGGRFVMLLNMGRALAIEEINTYRSPVQTGAALALPAA